MCKTKKTISWNEEDYDIFAEIVNLLAHGECVELYLEEQRKSVTLEKVSDCRNILGEEPEYPVMKYSAIIREDYEEIINTFILSESMRKHLIEQKLNCGQLLSIIQSSPVSIYKKRKYLRLLSQCEFWFFKLLDMVESKLKRGEKAIFCMPEHIHEEYEDSFYAQYHDVNAAIGALETKQGEVFSLKECWYDFDIKEQKEVGTTLFMDFDKAIGYIRYDIEYSKDDSKVCHVYPKRKALEQTPAEDESLYCWYKLEKWVPNEKNYMVNRYEYILIEDEICYYIFNEHYAIGEDKDGYNLWPPHTNLDFAVKAYIARLPIPFKTGEIVTIDCSPFVPKKRVLIIENKDTKEYLDWCNIQAIYQNEDGYWGTCNVRGGAYEYIWWQAISPMFRLERYTGDLQPEEEMYREIQNYLQGDEQKGETLWNAINDRTLGKNMGRVTTEQLREIINRDCHKIE